MRFSFDLHIHTCLSSCADIDMTANNIVGMAKLIGLDIIAITDHNSTLNCSAVVAASKRLNGPLIIPGVELETVEGIHTVILFPFLDAAAAANSEIQKMLPMLKDKGDIQRQKITDEFDNIIGYEQKALFLPTTLGIYDVKSFADSYGGVAFPAHIDRQSHGVLSVLGGVDELMGFSALEVTKYAPQQLVQEYLQKGYKILQNSDAHSLHLINESVNFLELLALDTDKVINSIKDKKR